jgi:deoxyribose-phosphate aldolase
MITAREAAGMIDISAVRTGDTLPDIKRTVAIAKQYRFINVHALPCWISELARCLKGEKGIFVGGPVGFPSGAHTTDVKLFEARQMLHDGVQEMDIVMNVGKLKNREYDYVEKELKSLVDLARGKALTKVIIEIDALSDEEMMKACDLVIECGADFVKTGTGWLQRKVNLDRVRDLKRHCGTEIKVKAAGGIRTREEFLALVDMGVERMGINTTSAIAIVSSFND